MKKAGWELDENGNILANEHNKALYAQKSGNPELSDAAFAKGIRNVSYQNMSAQDPENKLKLANALASLSDEKNGQTSLLEGLSNANGEIDVNHLTPEQAAALDRVQSWREQNEKRKAAGLPPISFEDYVHRGGLSQDVVIYKETKLPKVGSMAGKWHQAVDVMSDEEKGKWVPVQKRLGDTGLVVKEKSESNEPQVESKFK